MKRRKKNIAVTGANGYLGSFISDFLKKKYNIYKLTRFPKKNNKNLSDYAETLAIDSTRVLSKSTEYEDHPTTLKVSGTKKTVEILLKFRFKRVFGALPSHFGQ